MQPKGLLSSATCRTKAPTPPFGVVEGLDLVPLDGWDRHHRKLCDPFAPGEFNRLGSMIDEENADLTSITGIDETGTVDNPDTPPHRMTRSGKDQAGMPFGYGHREPCGHRCPLAGSYRDIDSGVKIYGRIADMCC